MVILCRCSAPFRDLPSMEFVATSFTPTARSSDDHTADHMFLPTTFGTTKKSSEEASSFARCPHRRYVTLEISFKTQCRHLLNWCRKSCFPPAGNIRIRHSLPLSSVHRTPWAISFDCRIHPFHVHSTTYRKMFNTTMSSTTRVCVCESLTSFDINLRFVLLDLTPVSPGRIITKKLSPKVFSINDRQNPDRVRQLPRRTRTLKLGERDRHQLCQEHVVQLQNISALGNTVQCCDRIHSI